MSFLKLTEQNVRGKTVLIRADLNVPIKDGKIGDDLIESPTLPHLGEAIEYLCRKGRGIGGVGGQVEVHPDLGDPGGHGNQSATGVDLTHPAVIG
mgnify:CR=1 FL=1